MLYGSSGFPLEKQRWGGGEQGEKTRILDPKLKSRDVENPCQHAAKACQEEKGTRKQYGKRHCQLYGGIQKHLLAHFKA